MKNIIHIFRKDVRGLCRNFFALVIAIGLCFIPSLYAWFNIYSNEDPYANTGNIYIAVASEDEGMKLEDGTTVNMGDQVMEQLKENKSIGWQFVDSSDEAISGVESGKYPGDNALYPRPFNDEYNNGRMGNSFYLEDASFVRLSNVRLSYDLPQTLSKKLFMKRLNVYFFANNVLTWTNYSGFDPEFSTSNPLQIGKDSYRYPRKREFGVGFNANF